MQNIEMVDLKGQYKKIKEEVDAGILEVIENSNFINGSKVSAFEKSLSEFMHSNHCIACANGTDALQIAMMALDLKPGDEIILPAFTYIATVEAAALLGVRPVLVDSNSDTFNVNIDKIIKAITPKTKAIVPVHLFGQCSDMESILKIARDHNLYIIEDTAQSLGAEYKFSDGTIKKAGTIGDIGITSFFPSKNLGCYGDGGALFTNKPELAERIKMIANHGQKQKYYHDIIGVNSRLVTLQAAVLIPKLKRITEYNSARQKAAEYYDKKFTAITAISIPYREPKSTHVFHQYTLQLKNTNRDDFKKYLESKKIPSMVYYPVPIHLQKAYQYLGYSKGSFPVAEKLCETVISLPMHTELSEDQLSYISETIINYFK